MADKILVNTDLLEKCAKELQQAASGFGDAASILAGLNTSEEWWTKMGRFSALKLQDEGSSAQMGDAGAAVRSLAGVMRRYDGRVNKLGANVSKAASMFKNIEKSLQGKAQGQSQGSSEGVIKPSDAGAAAAEGLGMLYGQPTDRDGMLPKADPNGTPGAAADAGTEGINSDQSVVIPGVGVVTTAAGVTTILYENGDRYEYERTWNKESGKLFGADGSYYEDTREAAFGSMLGKKKHDARDITPDSWKKLNTDNKAPDRKKTVFEFGAERTRSKSALHAEGEGSALNGLATGNYSADVSKLEATAELKAGLYKTQIDKNGKEVMVLEPGIDAKLGASYSVFTAAAAGQIGYENLNVHGSADVTVGKIGMEAETQVGIVDGKVAARVSGKAEAIAFEGSLEGGVNVAGIDVKAKGTVNVGIGAHADIGIHDGKLSCDIGASLGLGASVKFEVDYGQAVDNLAKGAKKAVKGTVKAIKGIGKAIKKWF